MPYQYTHQIWPSIYTVILLTVLVVYAWRRRNLPGASWFVVYCLLALPFLVFKVIGYLAVDFEKKVFWFNLEYPWWLPGTTAMTCFILEYAWPGRWVTRRTVALLAIVPLLGFVFTFSNSFHNLLFRGYEFNGSVVPLYGPVGWAFVVYNLGLRVVSTIALAWLFVRSPQHRWPAALIMFAEITFGVMLVLDPLISESWFLYLPEKAIPVVACAIALFGFRIFDPIPLAQQTVIEQLEAGILVLDFEGRVVSMNPAAERILYETADQVKGKLVKELLSAYPMQRLVDPDETDVELSFGEGASLRYYMLTNSLLNDFRGLEVGRLLLLHDVTERKRAQAQILEQQKVQAVLEERAGLARELHDSISQALAVAQIKAETTHELIDRGEISAAKDALSQLVDVTESAQVDIRQYLLGAKTLHTPGKNGFVALDQYVKKFSHDFNLPTELIITPGMKEQGIESRVWMQLIRIVQEGLANVRKHSQAGAAKVVFDFDAGWIQVRIEDDGAGFDVEQYFKSKDLRFGLRSMRERADTIGGKFQILSEPGNGTRVIVEVPCEKAATSPHWTEIGNSIRVSSSEPGTPEGDRPVPPD